MVAPINARDLALQQTTPRLLSIPANHITLFSNNLEVKYDSNNQPNPTTVEITAVLSGSLKGTVNFSAIGLAPGTQLVRSPTNPNKLILDPSTFAIDTIAVNATLLFEGVEYVAVPITIIRSYLISLRLARPFDNLPANSLGNEYALPQSNYLKLYHSTTEFTTGVIFGPATQTKSGLTCTVNSSTGEVIITDAGSNTWTSDYETFTFTATRNLTTYTVDYVISKTREGGTGPELTPPPTPTGFTALAAINTITIEHDAPSYIQGHGHAYTKIYGKVVDLNNVSLPVFNDAEVLGEFTGNIYALPSEPATSWRLWIKWFSKDGVGSEVPAGGDNGLLVTTAQDVTKLLDALAGEITESQLYSTLGARIDLIDDPNTGLVKVTNDLVTTYGSTTAAANSASQAAQSAVDAAGSASSASISASTAATSATNAGNSATAAATSASNAATSADNAGNSASSAATSASTAATSASNAGNSATAAATSASNAATSADNAGNSASTASTQAGIAATSATDAGNSATAAATSASSASTSAANASNSATAAATSLQNVQATIRGTSLGLPLEQWTLNGQSIVNIPDGKVGTKALRLSGNPGAYPNQGNYVAIDPSKKYRIRFWARPSTPSPSGILYFSLRQFLDDQGTAGPINAGRSPYKPSGKFASQHEADYGVGAWGEYNYVWSASDWQEGVKFVQPEFLDNYSGGTGYWDIQGFTFYDITDIDAVSAAVQVEATARASETGELFAQYSVKVDLAGNVAGYGLMSTSRDADVIDWGAVASGVLQAVSDLEPGKTLFNEVINGRKLGDTDANGDVSLSDGINILKYNSGVSIPADVTAYIEGPLTSILLADKFKYSVYFTLESQATSEFGIRADRFYIAPPSYVSDTAPTFNLYKGRVWVDTTMDPPVTKYWTGSTWSTIPQALPFTVVTDDVWIDGETVPAGVYIDTAFIRNATITTAKIAQLAVDNAKIADLAVDNAKIANLAVDNAKIADLAVDDLKIADNSVTLYSSYTGGTGTLLTSYVGELLGATGYVWVKPGQTVSVDIIFDLQFKYDPKFDSLALNSIQLRRTPAGGGNFDVTIGTVTAANFAVPLTPVTYSSNVYTLFKRIENVPIMASFTYTNEEITDVAIQGFWAFNGNTLSQAMNLMRNFGRIFVRIK